jgi:hypothetical protein
MTACLYAQNHFTTCPNGAFIAENGCLAKLALSSPKSVPYISRWATVCSQSTRRQPDSPPFPAALKGWMVDAVVRIVHTGFIGGSRPDPDCKISADWDQLLLTNKIRIPGQ